MSESPCYKILILEDPAIGASGRGLYVLNSGRSCRFESIVPNAIQVFSAAAEFRCRERRVSGLPIGYGSSGI